MTYSPVNFRFTHNRQPGLRAARSASQWRVALSTFAIATSVLMAATPSGAQDVAYSPAFRVAVGTAVTPAAAMTYYGAGTTHTNSTGVSVPNEVKALARALGAQTASANPGAYVDRVYDYVRNVIDTEPMFGAAKGPLGAMLDRSGTAFDQCELMIDLLREGGITASYKLGDLSVTASDAASWFQIARADGTFDQTILTQFLADAGIPYTGTTTITMLHLWVAATISGTSYAFDPSHKGHSATNAINLTTASGYNSTTAATGYLGGSTSGTVTSGGASVPTLKVLNNAALETSLDTASDTLLGYVQSNLAVSDVDAVLGVRKITPQVVGSPGPRQTTLPSTTLRSTWTDIPDQFRTKLTVKLEDPFVTVAGGGSVARTYFNDVPLFVDQIYGQRTWIDTVDDLSDFHLSLIAGGVTVAGSTDDSQPGAAGRRLHATNRSSALLTLRIDHPYAAEAGAYVDKEARYYVDYVQPIDIVIGVGRFSGELATKLTSVTRPERIITPVFTQTNYPDGHDPQDQPYRVASDAIKLQIDAGWQAQDSRMLDLQTRIADAGRIEHHRLGLVYSSSDVVYELQTGVTQTPLNSTNETTLLGDDAVNVSVDTALSLQRRSTDVTGLVALRHSIAVASAALEGSIHEQLQGLVDTVSTATRFDWANETRQQSGTCSGATETCADRGQRRFGLATTSAQLSGLISAMGAVYQSDYTTLGVNQIAIESYASVTRTLGPGPAYSVRICCVNNGFNIQGEIKNNWTRGPASLAYKNDGTLIVHEVSNIFAGHKGGAGSADKDQASKFDPSKAADILKDTFKDRTHDLGVDLASGLYNLSPEPDLVEGGGNFPTSLSFQRSFTNGGGSTNGMPIGWTHNWDYSANVSGSGMEAMGASSARAASPSLVAFLAMQRNYAAGTGLAQQLQGLATANWWRKQLQFNLLTVKAGGSSERFFRIAKTGNDTWLAQNGDLASLSTTSYDPGSVPIRTNASGSFSRTYNFVTFALAVTRADKSVLTFANVVKKEPSLLTSRGLDEGPLKNPNSSPDFVASSLTLANSNVIAMTWGPGPRIASVVSNAFSRRLDFNYQAGLGMRPLLSVTAPNAGTATITLSTPSGQGFDVNADQMSQVALPAGRTWGYVYTPGLGRALMQEIYDPVQMEKPLANRVADVRLDYDLASNVASVKDSIAVSTPASRQPYQILVAEFYRGARVDPAGNTYQVFYDDERHATAFVDELNRTSQAAYDPWDRVISRTYPEGNQDQFSYDAGSHISGITRIAKSGSGLANLQASAIYDTVFGKPASVTDFRGNTTNITYVQTGAGRGEILQALRPAVDGIRPQYDFTYTTNGLLDTLTTKVSSTASTVDKNYYDGSGNRTKSVIDNAGLRLPTCYDYDAVGNQTGVTDGRSASCVP